MSFKDPLAAALIKQSKRYNALDTPLPQVVTSMPLTVEQPTSLNFDTPALTPERQVQAIETPTELGTIPGMGAYDQFGPMGERNEMRSNGSYFDKLRQKESTDNYRAVNKYNYLGGYQMGASALIEAGLVKPGTTNKGLDNPKNWKNGLSKEAFLSNPELQDSAVKLYTDKNKKYLGKKYANASPAEQRALLASAHLIGAGATKKNMYTTDANGVAGMDYYNEFLRY